MEPREVSWRAEVVCSAAPPTPGGERETKLKGREKGRMKRFWTSLLGFASLLAFFLRTSAGGSGKGREALVGTGRVQLRDGRWTRVARAADIAATEAAERSRTASAWQEELATALSRTHSATALKALGSAAKLQSENAKVGEVALRLAREAATWAIDIRSAVFASPHSLVAGWAANCAFQRTAKTRTRLIFRTRTRS
ncbi:hypothetical protein ERJ75_001378700 [Trypanosoma vivax]|nr:hypothetical protein ERJ75_001378700 [Trypanosoma vivax]